MIFEETLMGLNFLYKKIVTTQGLKSKLHKLAKFSVFFFVFLHIF